MQRIIFSLLIKFTIFKWFLSLLNIYFRLSEITAAIAVNIPPGKLKFTLKNKISELNKLAEELQNFSSENNLSNEVLFDINLALDELVTNIISYGFDDDDEHLIFITISKNGSSIEILLEDEGKEFNPLEQETPDLDKPIEDREIGGLGIYFVKKKMNEISYNRNGIKNILKLVKNI